MNILINDRTYRTASLKAIGKGGEADIYALPGGEVLKLFKDPSHPDLEGLPMEQQAAKARILEHQNKLLAFPKGLPTGIVAPKDIAYQKRKGTRMIVGYTMPLVSDAEVLFRYAEKSFRESGVPDDLVVRIFQSLHTLVRGLHPNVVIGDFNDLNVLVTGSDAHIIDADSFQFGKFLSRVFTAKFLDPRLGDYTGKSPMLVRPHDPDSDWYAFTIMLMQSLLYVGPYGGVYRPKEKSKRLPHNKRPRDRITVFDDEVIYPKPARPYDILPLDLLHHLHQVFKEDKRGEFPERLLHGFEWKECTECGLVHARSLCPVCTHTPVERLREVHTGMLSAQKVFSTSGKVIFAAKQQGKVRWLYHQENGYYREDGTLVTKSALDPHIRYRIHGEQTILAKGKNAYVFAVDGTREHLSVDAYGMLPMVDANGEVMIYSDNGVLKRIGKMGSQFPERVGDVLEGQTLFWVGEQFGFGFYRAGKLSRYFVFSAKGHGINDSVQLPKVSGQIVDSTCFFGSGYVWFFIAAREGSDIVHRAMVIDETGRLIASCDAIRDDGSWLGTLRGKAAVGKFLLVSTDEGILRVEIDGSTLSVVKEFPETARFVSSSSQIFPGKAGILVVNSREIWNLSVS